MSCVFCSQNSSLPARFIHSVKSQLHMEKPPRRDFLSGRKLFLSTRDSIKFVQSVFATCVYFYDSRSVISRLICRSHSGVPPRAVARSICLSCMAEHSLLAAMRFRIPVTTFSISLFSV